MPASALNYIGRVTAQTRAKADEILSAAEAAGHRINHIWGYDPNKSNTEHHSGRALDFMTPTSKKAGDWIADYVWEHRERLGLIHVIWRQRIRSTITQPGVWRAMADRGSVTENHMDHPHVWFNDNQQEASMAGWIIRPGERDNGTGVIPGALADLYQKRGFTRSQPAIVGNGWATEDNSNLEAFARVEGMPWEGGLTYPLVERLRTPVRVLGVDWWNQSHPIDVRYGRYALHMLGYLPADQAFLDQIDQRARDATDRFYADRLVRLGRGDGTMGPKGWATLAAETRLFTPLEKVDIERVLSPVPGRRITTPYGKRTTNPGQWREMGGMHGGDDWAANYGEPVVAVVDGRVTLQQNSVLGNIAVLSGDNGRIYYYCHLKDRTRVTGRVKAGQKIAEVGSTGTGSTGPHLHKELQRSASSRGVPIGRPTW